MKRKSICIFFILLVSVLSAFSPPRASARALSFISDLEFDQGVQALDLADGFIVAGSGSILYAIEKQDNGVLIELGSLEFDGIILDLKYLDGLIYLAVADIGIVIIDAEDPENLSVNRSYELEGFQDVAKLETSGDFLFLLNDGICLIFNISDPDELVFVHEFEEECFDLILENDLLFLGNDGNMFSIYDVSDPENPELLSSTELEVDISWFRHSLGEVIAQDTEGGFWLITLENPREPVVRSIYHNFNVAMTAAFIDRSLYRVEADAVMSVRFVLDYEGHSLDGRLLIDSDFACIEAFEDYAVIGNQNSLTLIRHDFLNRNRPGLRIDIEEYDFGIVDVDDSESLDITVFNEDIAAQSIREIQVIDPFEGFFSVERNFDPIPPGGQITFRATFSPLWRGQRTTRLAIATTDFAHSRFNVHLTGEGRLNRDDVRLHVPWDFEFINQAFNAAVPNDTIVLHDDIYSDERDFNIQCDKPISLIYEGDLDQCVIDGRNIEGSRAIRYTMVPGIISGISFRNFNRQSIRESVLSIYYEGDVESETIIENCSFIGNNNRTTLNIVLGEQSSCTLRNTDFTNNTNESRWLRVIADDILIENCDFRNNSRGVHSNADFRADHNLRFDNCVFENNSVTANENIRVSSPNLEVNNCLAARDPFKKKLDFDFGACDNVSVSHSTFTCRLRFSRMHEVSLRDCIIWRIDDPERSGLSFASVENSSVTNSCVSGGFEGEGNIDSDPLLFSGYENNSKCNLGFLHPDSPCIDAGSMSVEDAGMEGLTAVGNLIPDEDQVDIGYHRNPEGFIIGGSISGTVTDFLTGEPVANTEILIDYGIRIITAEDGEWEVPFAWRGDRTINIEHEDYEPEEIEIELGEGEEIQFETRLRQALLSIDTEEISTEVEHAQSTGEILRLGNEGSSDLHWEAIHREILDYEPWTIIQSIDFSETLYRRRLDGFVVTPFTYFFAGVIQNQRNLIFTIDQLTNEVDSYVQPGGDHFGFSDLIQDDESLIGLVDSMVYRFTEEGAQLSQHEIIGRRNVCFTHDSSDDNYWIIDNEGILRQYNQNWEFRETRETGILYPDGMIFNPNDPDDIPIYILDQVEEQYLLYRYNTEDNETSLYRNLGEVPEGGYFGSAYLPVFDGHIEALVSLYVNEMPRLDLWHISNLCEWVNIPVTEGVIAPGEETEVEVILGAEDLSPGFARTSLTIFHNTPDDSTVIPILMQVNEIPVGVENSNIQPTCFQLCVPYPNPFNSKTNIGFTSPSQSEVILSVYDIKGRLVELITNKDYSVGYHNLIWDAENIPTGLYLIRMEAQEYTTIQKVTLIR